MAQTEVNLNNIARQNSLIVEGVLVNRIQDSYCGECNVEGGIWIIGVEHFCDFCLLDRFSSNLKLVQQELNLKIQ